MCYGKDGKYLLCRDRNNYRKDWIDPIDPPDLPTLEAGCKLVGHLCLEAINADTLGETRDGC